MSEPSIDCTETITDEVMELVVDFIVGMNPGDEPIDWENELYRAESALHVDLPDNYTHPVIRKIQRRVRTERTES